MSQFSKADTEENITMFPWFLLVIPIPPVLLKILIFMFRNALGGTAIIQKEGIHPSPEIELGEHFVLLLE